MATGRNIAYIENKRSFGNLKIIKTDEDTGQPLANVGFRLQFIEAESEKYKQYVGQFVSANGYSTDPNNKIFTNGIGEIVLENLYKGTYKLIETDCPDGYYTKEELQKGVVLESNLVVSDGKTEYYASNKKQRVVVKGNVWEDFPGAKELNGKGNSRFDQRSR